LFVFSNGWTSNGASNQLTAKGSNFKQRPQSSNHLSYKRRGIIQGSGGPTSGNRIWRYAQPGAESSNNAQGIATLTAVGHGAFSNSGQKNQSLNRTTSQGRFSSNNHNFLTH